MRYGYCEEDVDHRDNIPWNGFGKLKSEIAVQTRDVVSLVSEAAEKAKNCLFGCYEDDSIDHHRNHVRNVSCHISSPRFGFDSGLKNLVLNNPLAEFSCRE